MDVTSVGLNSTIVQTQSSAATRSASSATPASTASSSSTASTTTLSATQGAQAVDKALTASRQTFDQLRSLQADIKAVTEGGRSLDEATRKSLNDRIAALAKSADAAAKAGGNNLLSASTGTVSVKGGNGVDLALTGQTQDAKSLGLTDANGKVLTITDDASLRQVTGAIAQAAGKAQLTNFRLEAAQGLTGVPKTASSSSASVSATANVSRALANQLTGLATGQVAGVTQPASNPNADALASVQKALDASRSYNQTSQQSASSAARQSFLRLFA